MYAEMKPSRSDNHVYSLREHLVLLTAVVKDGMIVFPVLQVVQHYRNTDHKGGFKASAHDVTDIEKDCGVSFNRNTPQKNQKRQQVKRF